jgi:hypothetical protein
MKSISTNTAPNGSTPASSVVTGADIHHGAGGTWRGMAATAAGTEMTSRRKPR